MVKKRPGEIELLKASLQGQTTAFEFIVKKYQSLICAITYSATGSVERSEDLAQQAFVKCWKNLGQLKDLTKFRAWLCSIARHAISDSYRRQENDITSKAIPMDSIQEQPSEDTGPVEAAISKEREAIVNEALSKIPDTFREPLVLYYREERSYRQVAEQLGFSEHTARQRISRARSLLREKVASVVEETIERTKPGKVFTTAVIASIAGLAIKGTGAAAAAGIGAATTTAGTSTGISAIMSGVTAKIITAAAITAIGVGAVVTYKQVTKPTPEPNFSQAGVIAQEQGNEQDKTTEEVIGQFSDETADLSTLPIATHTLDTKEFSGLTTEVMQKTDKNNSTTSETNSIPVQSDDNIIVGGLVKSEDGNPISGVDVQLLWDVKRGGMPMFDGKSTVTDPNGRWECQITGESEDVSIRLKHPDFLSKFSDYRPSFDDLLAKSAVLIMRKGLQIYGFVFDIDGYPVPDALIMPPGSITSTSAAYGIQDSAKTTRTDANGYFFLGAVKPGLQDIAIDANGYAPAFVSVNVIPEMPPVEVTLDRGQTLTGIVVDINGVPLSGVKIKIDEWEIMRGEDTNNFRHKNFKILRRQTITNATGEYTLEHLPSIGDVDMAFIKRPHLLSSSIKNNMAQNKTKAVTMYPIPTITGTVIDADSRKPITEFEVVAGCTWDPNSVGSWNLSSDKITSPQGNFSKTKSNFTAHESPLTGWAGVKIRAKGYLPAQSPWMQIGQELSPITIRLKKAQILSSTLFYSDGVAVSNADVIVIEPSSWVYVKNGKLDEGFIEPKYSVIQTDPKGYFEFSSPSAPTKILVLDYDEYLVADTNGLKDKLTLTPWAYVSGLVETDNNINSNITVQIEPEYDPNEQIRWMSEQTTNADGRFEFFYIPAIPQKTRYGSADSTNTLNIGPEINPRPNQELELRLGTIKPVNSNITSTEKSQLSW